MDETAPSQEVDSRSQGEAIEATELPSSVAVSVAGYVSSFRTGASGGYRVVVDIPEIEVAQAKNLLDFHNKNVQVAFVLLPS